MGTTFIKDNRLSIAYTECPICRSRNHPNVSVCMTCGATVEVSSESEDHRARFAEVTDTGYGYGENDLHEATLWHTARRYNLIIICVIFITMIAGLGLAYGETVFDQIWSGSDEGEFPFSEATGAPTPTLAFSTVTQGPPTPTASETLRPSPTHTQTPTPEPCIQEVLAGDGLYAIVARCGHLSFDVLEAVIATNNLPDANSIIEGQILEVPWPTPTDDPNSTPTSAPTNASSSGAEQEGIAVVSAFDENFDPQFVPTSTLPPGIQFHTVLSGETIIDIGFAYNATVDILSQLNPEITFSQCDFGETFGGPRCTVPLAEGQQVRVPAPTQTPTVTITLSGSETATPTATPTFNAPRAESPANRDFFRSNQLITLRWIATGTLGDGQIYLVQVEDISNGILYEATTPNTFFIVQDAWQGARDEIIEYAWTISVINENNPDAPLWSTETRTFTWEGRDQ